MKKLLIILILFVTAEHLLATDHLATTTDEAVMLLQKAKAGDRILLKEGVYKDANIKFHTDSGTQYSPVTFAAQTPGKCFFEGNSLLSFSGKHILISGFIWQKGGDGLGTKPVIEFRTASNRMAEHSILQDCAIISYNSDKNIDNKWVSIYGAYNAVTSCLFKDKNNLGATLTVWLTPGKEAHHTISYNYFHGRGNGPQADNGLESIRIGDSKTSFEPSHCVVALNRFEDCDGEIEIISNKSFNNSYLHNTFYSNDGGLTLRHGNECLCDGNYFDGAGKPLAYGIRFIGEGHVAINNYFKNLNAASKQNMRAPVTLVTGVVNTPINGYFQVRRAVVADNVFVNCAMPNVRLGAVPNREGATLAPDTVSITSNLFSSDKNEPGNLTEEVLPVRHLTVDGNTILSRNEFAHGKGFSILKNTKSLTLLSGTKAASSRYKNAGASWVDPMIASKIVMRKYTVLSSGEVGPEWMRVISSRL